MKIVFVAIDAKYIHTNIAVRTLATTLRSECKACIDILEFTINNHYPDILSELYRANADIYLFSCYIWNIRYITDISAELHKIRPNATMLAGGPQVTYDAEAFLRINPAFSAVIKGEGEIALPLLVKALESGITLANCPSVSYINAEDEFIETTAMLPMNMDDIPFPYTEIELKNGRILYYETTRGCPFNCSYCLSSAEKGVRYKSFDKIEKELRFFLNARPKQVKFVDRTFNCNKTHAMGIWRFLCENDNGVTNFHFELSAELLDDDTIDFLQGVREGLFQFEIGVQSTNLKTLKEINRPANLNNLFEIICRLQKNRNIHIHLDLIAGLPYEDFESFKTSFNWVYALRPAQFQLGMLKVLAGSGIEQDVEKYGLKHSGYPPFEVLETRWMSYKKLNLLSQIADIVELYYNNGRFQYILEYLLGFYETAFNMYFSMVKLFEAKGYKKAPLSKTAAYQMFATLAKKDNFVLDKKAQWFCRLDLSLHEKPKVIPSWVVVGDMKKYYQEALNFYATPKNIEEYLPNYTALEPKQIVRTAHIERFPFNPFTNEEKPQDLLFDYSRRDIFGRAKVFEIEL